MNPRTERPVELIKYFFGCLLVACISVGAAIWVVYGGMIEPREIEQQHETWMQVPAHVTECKIHKAAARYRNQSSHEWLQVRYTYRVGGSLYESTEVGSMDRDRMSLFRDAAGAAYPAAYLPPDLCCFVNPDNPEESKLFTDALYSPWWWLAFLSVLSGGFALMALWTTGEYFWEICRRLGRWIARLLQ